MLLIGILVVLACAGGIYGSHLLKRSTQRQMAELIERMEQEAGLRNDPAREELERSGPLARWMPSAMLRSYDQQLLWAGRPYGLDGSQFISLKLVLAVLLPTMMPVLLFRLDSTTVMLMLIAGVAGFIMPDVLLNSLVASRTRQVAEELPLFADLVATAVSAGLSLTEAVRRVAADAPGLVAREFLRAVQEMAAGKPRQQAWRDLIDRVPGDDLRVIVSAIMQAEQYGTSVSDLLRYQVQQIRLFKQQEAQRIAQATTVRMRVPMLLFILVPFMMLLLGPALLQILQLL